MAIKYRLPSKGWLLAANILLIVILIICFGTHAQGQTYELQRGHIQNGELKITSTKRYPLARAYEERDKLFKQLKPGEVLIGPSWIETVSVEVREIDVLTVCAEGFTVPEIEAIKRALESWNVNGTRFVYQDAGQVMIKRQSLKVMALSVMQIQDDRLVSADVLIDPHVTDLKALESVIAHEAGHLLKLPDNKDRGSIMFHKSRGRNKTIEGHLGPSAEDLAAITLR